MNGLTRYMKIQEPERASGPARMSQKAYSMIDNSVANAPATSSSGQPAKRRCEKESGQNDECRVERATITVVSLLNIAIETHGVNPDKEAKDGHKLANVISFGTRGWSGTNLPRSKPFQLQCWSTRISAMRMSSITVLELRTASAW